ncbi:MAG TPA: hypothetical protein VLD39_07965 [Gammaproteobacteria bacterium]|nr:hypothetical protein [Gammaproteobacteria bacterium]
MNWTKVSAIAEILSSAAILVTLVYLAVEIQQNTMTLEATSRQAVLQGEAAHLRDVIDYPEIWLNMANPNMTDEQKVRLSAYLIKLIRTLEIDWLQYQSGALDENTWTTYESVIVDALGYSESRKWWEFYDSLSAWDSSFSNRVNELIEDVPIGARLIDLQAFD